MTDPNPIPRPPADGGESTAPDPTDAQGALSVPPPVPQRQPGFLRRLFMSRKKQQALAVQNGYLEMVDLIRAIRSHLDRQETVQTRVLSMLEKVPDTMERQHEVMSLFKQQLENNMENDRRLTDSMGRLSGTLDAMNESQKASSRTITDLIGRSRETEQLLREVMRRAERRMTFLIVFFLLLVIGGGFYVVHRQNRPAAPAAESAIEPAATETPAEPAVSPAPEPPAPDTPAPAPEAKPPENKKPAKPARDLAPGPIGKKSEPKAILPAAKDKKSAPAAAKPRKKDKGRDKPKDRPATEPRDSKPPKADLPPAAPAETVDPLTSPDASATAPAPLPPEAADLTLAPLQKALDSSGAEPAPETPVSLP
ncbi:MAG TPA: hypothetical protein PLJ99_03815 [Kiritimatiellia bacterium]|nr:hypothetical protein [Kiritimatiellia bacterium]HRX06483.1 hypothetical protein [Kiritimatiellia bacterium]